VTAARLILASASPIRAKILRQAGLAFTVQKTGVDEAAIKTRLAGQTTDRIAMALAEEKALAIKDAKALVIGADQILEYRRRPYDKPRSRLEARQRLMTLQGKRHVLVNAMAVTKAGRVVFRNLERPALYFREMSEREIDGYLDAAGEQTLDSVGAYQIEGLGATLVERIRGDYFAVLGLSLFPLLAFLRSEGLEAY